ncbi:hypothetical protein Syun_020889 [Stephania yunnanensis]|uniref:Uncharacterized protein n=1 Tax=Stephania yunnanensis TaxID=152371 RepID=A0AAP0IGL2_9MAGN
MAIDRSSVAGMQLKVDSGVARLTSLMGGERDQWEGTCAQEHPSLSKQIEGELGRKHDGMTFANMREMVQHRS